jgi:hypothetical protein
MSSKNRPSPWNGDEVARISDIGSPPRPLVCSPPRWDIGRPQPAFLTLADAGVIRGRVLDVGTRPGSTC